MAYNNANYPTTTYQREARNNSNTLAAFIGRHRMMSEIFLMKNEEDIRVHELDYLDIMDTGPKLEFDELTQLMAEIAEVPTCLISLLDNRRQWFKSTVGLDVEETPIEWSFCQYTIRKDDIFEIEDSLLSSLVRYSPLVTGPPHIRFYAGAPLITSRGVSIGSICLIDYKPNKLNALKRKALLALSHQVVKLIESRVMSRNYKKEFAYSLEQKQKLDKLNSVKDKLISIITHDFRSPLTQLKSYVSLLNADMLDEKERKQVISSLDDHLSHTLALLDNLLYWSRMQMEGFKVYPRKVMIREMLEEVYHLFHIQVLEKGIHYEVHVAQDLIVYADADMLRIILRNLLSNAIKFTRPGGSILLQARQTEGQIELVIKDDGVGVSSDVLNQLMQEGVSITTPGTQLEKGTGIGLSLSREFAKANNGSLDIESEAGKGTRVRLVLKHQQG